MKNRNNGYDSNRVRNMFLAYLVKAIENTRNKYLFKRNRIMSVELYLDEDIGTNSNIDFDAIFAKYMLELVTFSSLGLSKTLINYDLDYKLVKALHTLTEKERSIAYMHIFGELSFSEIAKKLDMGSKQVENVYYYAIRKLRSIIGGDNYGI